MEVSGGDSVNWINHQYSKARKVSLPAGLHPLPLGGRRIGAYLEDDCRHAIAHIRRRPGKTPLRFDVGDENKRMGISTAIVERFAAYYIRHDLGLSKKLYLVRRKGKGFPTYVDTATSSRRPFLIAYP